MATYEIVRYYEDDRRPRVMQRGLSEEQARKWCNDPETSSYTAKAPRGCEGKEKRIDKWHDEKRHWFDAFRKAA